MSVGRKYRIAILWSTGSASYAAVRAKRVDEVIYQARHICAGAPRKRQALIALVTPRGGQPIVAFISPKFGACTVERFDRASLRK